MNTKVYVGNINYTTKEETLREVFNTVGEVVSLNMITDRNSGRFRGFAFVEYDSPETAQEAITQINGKEVDGRELRVNEAREQRQQRRRPRFQ